MRDENNTRSLSDSSGQLDNQAQNPSVVLSLLFMFALFAFWQVSMNGLLFVLLYLAPGVAENMDSASIFYSYLVKIIISIVAVKGYRPIDPPSYYYIIMMIIAFIPLGGWVILYFAGKNMARMYMEKRSVSSQQ